VKWSFAQVGLLIISTLHVIQAVIGFHRRTKLR